LHIWGNANASWLEDYSNILRSDYVSDYHDSDSQLDVGQCDGALPIGLGNGSHKVSSVDFWARYYTIWKYHILAQSPWRSNTLSGIPMQWSETAHISDNIQLVLYIRHKRSMVEKGCTHCHVISFEYFHQFA
jgi:hypothetical protein